MSLKWLIVNGVLIIVFMVLVAIAVFAFVQKKSGVTVQPEKPDREYIQKYPIAGGGYQYILVREYELNVEFVETYEGEEK